MTTLTSIQHIGGLVAYPPTYTAIADYLNIVPNRFAMYQDGNQTGGSVTFTVTTLAVPNGTTLYYTVHQVAGIIDANTFTTGISGSFIVNSNVGTFTLTGDYHAVDTTDNYFNVKIRTISTSGIVRLTSSTIKIVNLVSWNATYAAYLAVPRTITYTVSTNSSITWNSHTITGNGGSNASGSSYGAGGTYATSFPSPISVLVSTYGGVNGGKGCSGAQWDAGAGGAVGGSAGTNQIYQAYWGSGGSRYYGSSGGSYNPSNDNSLRQGLINKGYTTTSNWSGTIHSGEISNTLSYAAPGIGSGAGGGQDKFLASYTCSSITFTITTNSYGAPNGTGLDRLSYYLYTSTSRPNYQVQGNVGGPLGGGGGGAALTFRQSGSGSYSTTWSTYSGGNGGTGGVIIFEWDSVTGDITRPDRYYVITTSGSRSLADTTKKFAVWAIGKGGNGAGSATGGTYPYSNVYNFRGGGGGGGAGMAWMNVTIPDKPPLPTLA